MTIVGIDPGSKGAVAIISPDGLTVEDTPYSKPAKGKGQYVLPAMVRLLAHLRDERNVHGFLELVGTRPGEGNVSAFNFGKGFGYWEMLLASLSIPYTLVTPRRWKAAMMADMSAEKNLARLRAQQLFPSHASLFDRVKDDGRAEAVLIAEWGRRQLPNR